MSSKLFLIIVAVMILTTASIRKKNQPVVPERQRSVTELVTEIRKLVHLEQHDQSTGMIGIHLETNPPISVEVAEDCLKVLLPNGRCIVSDREGVPVEIENIQGAPTPEDVRLYKDTLELFYLKLRARRTS